MIIKLNPSNADEKNAIDNQLTFYIDVDIVKTYTILKAGSYNFNPNIGNFGGYELLLNLK